MTTDANPKQPLQTAQMTAQQSRYRTALVRDQIGRLELAGETNAAELLREWYLEEKA
jgi:hypothetical protein